MHQKTPMQDVGAPVGFPYFCLLNCYLTPGDSHEGQATQCRKKIPMKGTQCRKKIPMKATQCRKKIPMKAGPPSAVRKLP